MKTFDFSTIRGFNYQPSIGSTSYENWIYFNEEIIRKELGYAKIHFPKMNSIRLWLSYDAFLQEGKKFIRNLGILLDICESFQFNVTICFFNRWHNTFCDNDGLYLDHFVKGSPCYIGNSFYPYIDEIMDHFGNRDSIVLWDLCNEPFSYHKPIENLWPVASQELAFLQSLAERVKSRTPSAPIGISLSGHDWANAVKLIEPFTDVLLIHPYWMSFADYDVMEKEKQAFADQIDFQCKFAEEKGKPILVTETCWGSADARERCQNMKYNLDILTKRGIGFLAHALSYSPVADLHYLSDGPVLNDMCAFHFVEKDGSLRDGHGMFNEYC